MIVYTNKSLCVARLWFDEALPDRRVDVIYHLQSSSPLPHAQCQDFYTITVDLSQAENVLFSRLEKDTRYEIRRGREKDNIVSEGPSETLNLLLEEFYNVYEKFSIQKGLEPVNKKLLSLLSESRSLFISWAQSQSGEKLVYHLYLRCGTRVRLLYSVSLFRDSQNSAHRNLIGRANRALHWNDIQRFKNDGVSVYDFGGWYHGKTDKEKLRINKFKEEFGGVIVKNYNCEEGVTLKGKAALLFRRYLLKG